MRQLGLIGYPLSHSFSEKYFTDKFKTEEIQNWNYKLFPLASIDLLPQLLNERPNIVGLNVTIPYKEQVIPYLTSVDEAASDVGAVNTIGIIDDLRIGFNSDIYGFEISLLQLIGDTVPRQALILGTGGAAKAVVYVLTKLGIPFKMVSRTPKEGQLSYDDLNAEVIETHHLLINTTPLGTYPNIDACPKLTYEALSEKHFLYDLVYNPPQTQFLHKGSIRGAKTMNGLEMLHLQAEKSWSIWNQLHTLVS